MTELAEIAMFIRLNWQYLVALVLILALAIVLPKVVKAGADIENKIWEERNKNTVRNIHHAMVSAKEQSDKKYGDQG